MPEWIPIVAFMLVPVVMSALVIRRVFKFTQLMRNPEQIQDMLSNPEVQRALEQAGQNPETSHILREAFKTALRNGNARVSINMGDGDLSPSTISALQSLQQKNRIEPRREASGPSSLTRFVLATAVIGGLAYVGWFLTQ